MWLDILDRRVCESSEEERVSVRGLGVGGKDGSGDMSDMSGAAGWFMRPSVLDEMLLPEFGSGSDTASRTFCILKCL